MKEDLNNLNYHNCAFKEIGEDTYEYRYNPAWVIILKNSDNEWCFQLLGNPEYCSKGYPNMQLCLDDAYEAMIASKL